MREAEKGKKGEKGGAAKRSMHRLRGDQAPRGLLISLTLSLTLGAAFVACVMSTVDEAQYN